MQARIVKGIRRKKPGRKHAQVDHVAELRSDVRYVFIGLDSLSVAAARLKIAQSLAQATAVLQYFDPRRHPAESGSLAAIEPSFQGPGDTEWLDSARIRGCPRIISAVYPLDQFRAEISRQKMIPTPITAAKLKGSRKTIADIIDFISRTDIFV
jgi:hypothetical protein